MNLATLFVILVGEIVLGSSYFVTRFVFIKCCTSTRKPTAITESSRCLSCRLVKTYQANAGPVLRWVEAEVRGLA